MIILMAGLPGSGKTTLTRALADRFQGSVLNKDVIRAALFPAADVEYSTTQDDLVQHIMLETAEFILRKHPSRLLFLDGRTFSRLYQIDRVLKVAAQLDQPWRILECVCSEATARHRLQEIHPAKDRDYELYKRVKAQFEPITLSKTVIDTDQPLETCLELAVDGLVRVPAPSQN